MVLLMYNLSNYCSFSCFIGVFLLLFFTDEAILYSNALFFYYMLL